jgi:hypothetical protein
MLVRSFSTTSSGVLRAAAARPSSAADQVPGPPASAGSRPYGLAGRSGTRRPVSASPVRIDLALRVPRLGHLHQDADRSIPLVGRK